MKKPKLIVNSSLFKSSGYTLIELLVAMSVFVIITTIAIGGYVRGIKTSRQAAALASANSNAASALEQMMREMRVGFAFSNSPSDCAAPCIKFQTLPISNPLSKVIIYQLDSVSQSILRIEDGDANQITDDNVKISSASFSLIKTTNYPDRILIQLSINAKEFGVDGGAINLQTTVSARN